MDTAEALSVLSVVLAVVTGAASAAAARRQARTAKEAVAGASGKDVARALEAADLRSLGDYLYYSLGPVPLAAYATDAEARRIVGRAVDEVERFIEADTSTAATGVVGDSSHELSRARDAIFAGETWDGLARLRRAIELELRELARSREIDFERAGAGQLMSRLRAAEVLEEPGVERDLRVVLNIANRGVHGEDVRTADAEEALHIAERVLAYLKSLRR